MTADISSKELVRDLFRFKEVSRPPFIPWVGTFAAKLEQIQVEDMLSDPGLLSTALLNSQELFGYDAIVTIFDPSLEAEACGCEIEWSEDHGSLPQVVSHPFTGSIGFENLDIQNLEKRGRIPVFVEAIKRITLMRGKRVAIMGMVTGPFTLARQLVGEGLTDDLQRGSGEATKVLTVAGSIALKLCRTYCELGVDVIVINDEMLGKMDAGAYTTVATPLKSIWNVARFFDVRSLVLTSGVSPEKASPIIDLQADGVSLGTNVDTIALQKIAAERKVCYGLSIPTAVLNIPAEAIKLSEIPSIENRKGCFITTDGEVPYTTSVETMQEIMRIIHPS